MDALVQPEVAKRLHHKTQITASDLPFILDHYGEDIKTLSLDCFDTLIWRQTAAPKDIFHFMQQRPAFRALGVTAYQRISAAQRAYRLRFATHGTHEIKIRDIYRGFTGLTAKQQQALAEEELLVEMELCYAFPPFVELIRSAYARHIKIVIVSDTYFDSGQLRRLLASCLPEEVMCKISHIFCSSEYALSKSTGLFTRVLQTLAEPAEYVLHVGDHKEADFSIPRRMGLNALHFIQSDEKTASLLRMQNMAAALGVLAEPSPQFNPRPPRLNPFRGVFAASDCSADHPPTLIGYMTFGPILFAFAQFITHEIDLMRQAGKNPKVFFLLRDAHLLEQACTAYAGRELGKRVRIRKFVTVAASFRTRADVDEYLCGIAPSYYNFHVICEQLLLPPSVTQKIIQISNASPQPEKTFNELIHHEEVLQTVFKHSASYRERLLHYIKKEMGVVSGDTLMLVDMGYVGVTQKHLIMTLRDEIEVDITGRYLIASHEPDRPACKALITSTACDHGLFEQSCTLKEGAVLDYDGEGNPIFDRIRLTDAQYTKVNAVQAEAIRFIQDAKEFFASANAFLSSEVLQEAAAAALRRHVYFPQEAEVSYYLAFQHDKDMGPALTKTMYSIQNGLSSLKQTSLAFNLQPYEARTANLEIAFSALLQKSLNLEVSSEDMSLCHEVIKLTILRNNTSVEIKATAIPTHDGYFSCFVPSMPQAEIWVLFGQHYVWLQIESIKVMGHIMTNAQFINQQFMFTDITNRSGNLYECVTEASMVRILPLSDPAIEGFQIVYRPILRRG